MTVSGGSSCRYYTCTTSRKKGICSNRRAIKEPIARTRILAAIHERLTSPTGVAHVRKAVAEYLGDYARNREADINERRERIKRTEDKIRGLVEFIAQGDRSQYIASALRDLVEQTHEPLRLPSVDDVTSHVYHLYRRLQEDPRAGRAQLIRVLRDGRLTVTTGEDGKPYARG